MLKGKPVKELNDSNLNPSRQGTGPFRIRSLLIYLKQVFLQPLQLFSQDVFIQKRRYQNTFLSREQPSVHGFPFLLRGYHRLGCPQGKDNQMWNTAGTFRSYTSDTANPDHVVVIGVGRTAGSTTRSSAQGEISAQGEPISASLSSKIEVKGVHISRTSRLYFASEEFETNRSYLTYCRCSPKLVFFFFFGWVADTNSQKLSFVSDQIKHAVVF